MHSGIFVFINYPDHINNISFSGRGSRNCRYHYEINNHYGSLVPGQDRNNQILLLNLKKYIDFIRHSINVDNNLSFFEYDNFVNSDSKRINKNYNTYTRFSLKSAFDSPINYTVGGIFRYNIFKTNISSESHSRYYSFFQDLSFKPNKKLNIKLYFDEYFVGRENKFYMFIRPNVSYAFDKCNLSVEATAYNMMNYNYLSEYGISDYYSEEALYSVIPAQYLLNIQLRF